MIGVMPSPSVRELLPLGDRILIEVNAYGSCPCRVVCHWRRVHISIIDIHGADCCAVMPLPGRRLGGADSRRPAHVSSRRREAHARPGGPVLAQPPLGVHQRFSCGRCLEHYVTRDPCGPCSCADLTPHTAQVIKVGSGRVDEKTNEVVKPNVEVGSTVLYSKYSGTEFSDDDDSKSYIVVRESDIIAALA